MIALPAMAYPVINVLWGAYIGRLLVTMPDLESKGKVTAKGSATPDALEADGKPAETSTDTGVLHAVFGRRWHLERRL